MPSIDETAGGASVVGPFSPTRVWVMIHLNCPNCGRRGIVPDTKLYTRLHCSKCDVVFHVEHNGQVLLGEPGGKRKPKAGDPDQPLTVGEEDEEETLAPSELIERMPTPILVTLVVFLLMALAWGVRAYWYSEGGS
jgi:ribosomal protein S27AE